MSQRNVADELAIRNHYAAYTYAVDDHDVKAWGDLYTDDARIEVGSFNAVRSMMKAGLAPFANAEGWVVGKQNIIALQAMVPLEVKCLHVTSNLWIRKLEGDYCEAQACFAVFADDGIMEHYGRYYDKLKKCADGRWRFTERRDVCRYERDREAFGLDRTK